MSAASESRALLRAMQGAVGEVLIPEARAAQQAPVPAGDDALPLALEMAYTALAVKARYRDGAMFMARRFADRMGLDGGDVEAFAHHRLAQVLADRATEPPVLRLVAEGGGDQ